MHREHLQTNEMRSARQEFGLIVSAPSDEYSLLIKARPLKRRRRRCKSFFRTVERLFIMPRAAHYKEKNIRLSLIGETSRASGETLLILYSLGTSFAVNTSPNQRLWSRRPGRTWPPMRARRLKLATVRLAPDTVYRCPTWLGACVALPSDLVASIPQRYHNDMNELFERTLACAGLLCRLRLSKQAHA